MYGIAYHYLYCENQVKLYLGTCRNPAYSVESTRYDLSSSSIVSTVVANSR